MQVEMKLMWHGILSYCFALICISHETANQIHLRKYMCVTPSAVSTHVFTACVSSVECVTRCQHTDRCVAVAVDGSGQQLMCATLTQEEVPYTVSKCGDVTATVVIYKDPSVEITGTANNSCHCLYDTGSHDNQYTQAEHTCGNLAGHLPEADTLDTLQVCQVIIYV